MGVRLLSPVVQRFQRRLGCRKVGKKTWTSVSFKSINTKSLSWPAGAEVHEDPYAVAQAPLADQPPSVTRCLSFGTLSPDRVEGSHQDIRDTHTFDQVAAVTKTLSQQALRKRVERLMKAKEDGTLKVPEEFVKEWHSGNQHKLLEDFKEAGLDKDPDPSYPMALVAQSGFQNLKTFLILTFFPLGLGVFSGAPSKIEPKGAKVRWNDFNRNARVWGPIIKHICRAFEGQSCVLVGENRYISPPEYIFYIYLM